MKRINRIVSGVMILMILCLCFTACDDSSSTGVLDFMKPQGTQQSTTTTTVNDDEQKMLTFKREPSSQDLTKQQRDRAAEEFTVYYSGRAVNEKTGETRSVTGSELEKLKKYAQDILDKKIESKFEGGDPNYNITVGAFDKTINSNTLSAMDKCSIDGFDEMFKIVSEKFTSK